MIPTPTPLPRIAAMTYARTIPCDSLAEAYDVARVMHAAGHDVWIWYRLRARRWPH